MKSQKFIPIIIFTGVTLFLIHLYQHHSNSLRNDEVETSSNESKEGPIKIEKEILRAANIQISTATSRRIKIPLEVVGKIVFNRDSVSPIYPRYSGIIKKMNRNLGDEVSQGDVLATIESNDSLQDYKIYAPIAGTIVRKYATTGEIVQNTKPIYEIANLNDVWADLTLYRKEALLVKPGMKVTVIGDEGTLKSIGTIFYIAPLSMEHSQTILARTLLSNKDRMWLPGMYVKAFITLSEKKVPIAVHRSAIQQIQGKEVVFIQQKDHFEPISVILGEKNFKWVEVVSGITEGMRYVSKNSFLMKAELRKESAGDGD